MYVSTKYFIKFWIKYDKSTLKNLGFLSSKIVKCSFHSMIAMCWSGFFWVAHCIVGFLTSRNTFGSDPFSGFATKMGGKAWKIAKWQGFLNIFGEFPPIFYLWGLIFNLYPLDDRSWSCFLGRLKCLFSNEQKHT